MERRYWVSFIVIAFVIGLVIGFGSAFQGIPGCRTGEASTTTDPGQRRPPGKARDDRRANDPSAGSGGPACETVTFRLAVATRFGWDPPPWFWPFGH